MKWIDMLISYWQKGIFLDDFFDDISKLDYTEFPTREKLFSELADKEYKMEDYLHAKLVWQTF